MASTSEGAALTVAHQRQQIALARTVQAQTVLLWRMLDPTDLDAASDEWSALQTQMILAGRRSSGLMAANYLAAYRTAEIGAPLTAAPGLESVGGVLIPRNVAAATSAERARILASSTVTGPVRVKQSMALGRAVDVAMRDGLAGIVGSTQRNVLSGGRETIGATTRADRQATGYARVITTDNPCAFCLMLASRGAVYGESSGDFEAHDGCGCSAEPEYRATSYELPPGAEDAKSLWAEFTSPEVGGGNLQDFRAWYDARQRA